MYAERTCMKERKGDDKNAAVIDRVRRYRPSDIRDGLRDGNVAFV